MTSLALPNGGAYAQAQVQVVNRQLSAQCRRQHIQSFVDAIAPYACAPSIAARRLFPQQLGVTVCAPGKCEAWDDADTSAFVGPSQLLEPFFRSPVIPAAR